ncbi:MAG: hypothetical protein K0Q55_1189, partial [Verrucomicrobia bacterium]|nr:hypothetical protein [Verrucomicrobiota bacterium]
MINSSPETNASSKVKAWHSQPAFICFLHLDSTGRVQHAEGNIGDLFGPEGCQGYELANHLKWSGNQ